MSPTVLIICFIAMGLFTATVLIVGTALAAGILPRQPKQPEQPPEGSAARTPERT